MDYLYFLYLKLLSNYNISDFVAMITFPVVPFCMIAFAMIIIVLFLVLAERKILALFTQRKGPNRVGPWGLLQTVADAIKLLCKENITPNATDRLLFNLAPLLVFIPVLIIWGLIPYSSEFQFMSFSVNLLLFTTFAVIPVLGILLAGYASNNKYSLIGAMRSVAQAISYELPLMFALLGVVVLSSSLNLKQIVLSQISIFPFCGWNIFPAFLGFFVMFICTIAELNRCPFDLPEAESELVGGYNTEYSGMRFAFFFLAEYAMMFVLCAFMATLFLGGFLSPFGFYLSENLFFPVLYVEQIFWLLLKTFFLVFLVIWVRATLPRLKSQDLMGFAWKFLLPIAIVNLFWVCVYKFFLNLGGAL